MIPSIIIARNLAHSILKGKLNLLGSRPPLQGMSAFYFITFGQLISLLGSGISSFGISVWVLRETGSTLAYSGVLVFILLPIALGSFIAGPLVDRWDRRRILIITDSVSAGVTVLLALLYTTIGLQLWHIYVALFVSGIALAFQFPAQQAIIPLLVPKEQLGRAAGVSQLPGSVSEIAAPVMAGILLTAVGLGGVLLIDFVTFLVGITTVLLVRIPPPQAAPEKTGTSFREEFLAGFRFLWDKRPFRYLTGFITLTVGILGAYQALYPPLILALGNETTLGIANTIIGVSALVGTTLLSIIVIRRRMRAIYLAGLVMGVSGLIAGWQPNLFIAIPALAIGFGVLPILIGLNRVLYQVKAPAEILGRVFAFRLAVRVIASKSTNRP